MLEHLHMLLLHFDHLFMKSVLFTKLFNLDEIEQFSHTDDNI